MPSINLDRIRRPQTAPERVGSEPTPSFSAVEWIQRQRRRPSAVLATQNKLPSPRRFSATTLLDQNEQSGLKAFHSRTPSVPPIQSGTSSALGSDQRASHRNSWLGFPAAKAENSLKQFVAERKASVDNAVRKVRARSGNGSAAKVLSSEEGPEYIYDQSQTGALLPDGFALVRTKTSSTQACDPSVGPLTSTLPDDLHSTVNSVEDQEPRSPDAEPFAFYTPAATPSNGATWLVDLSTTHTPLPRTADIDDPFITESEKVASEPSRHPKATKPHLPIAPNLSARPTKSARRPSQQQEPTTPRPLSTFSHFRHPTAPSDYLWPPNAENLALNMHGSSYDHDGRTSRPKSQTPTIVASTSEETVPVDMPDEPERRGDQVDASMEKTSGSSPIQQLVKTSFIGGHPIFDVTDCRTLQYRIVQLEKELDVARHNADMWMTKYAVLSAKHDAQLQTQPVDKRRRSFQGSDAAADEDSEGAATPMAPSSPRERKSRRLSTGQVSTHSVHGLLFAPIDENAHLRQNDAEMAIEKQDSSQHIAHEANRDNADYGSEEADRGAEWDSMRSKREHEEVDTTDSVYTSLHRPLSVSENLDYLASAPAEGIDAATLNSLMPEGSGNRRQRGFSSSSGISTMAAGIKAKLRSSPASTTQALPAMPPKSPHRPTYKLFGRRTSAYPSSNASIGESGGTPLLPQTPKEAGDGSQYRFSSTSINSPRNSRAFEVLPTSRQRSATADNRSSPMANRQRSTSVSSKLSMSSIQAATKRVSATLNNKNGGMRLHGIGNASTDSAGARLITPSMIGQPVLISSNASKGDLGEAVEIRTHERSSGSNASRPPGWLETIAFEASSSDEDEDSPAQRPSARQYHTMNQMVSAKASSTVLARYMDLPTQASDSIDYSIDSMQQSRAESEDAEDTKETKDTKDEVRAHSNYKLPSEQVPGLSAEARSVNRAPSTSTFSSAVANHHGLAGEEAARQSQVESPELSDTGLASTVKCSTTLAPGIQLERKSSTGSRSSTATSSDASANTLPMKRSDMVPFSGPALLHVDPPQRKGLVSTRVSTRSQNSLRNRPPLASSILSLASTPMSQSSSKTGGSHEVRISIPQSPAPPSPALSSSPLAESGANPISANQSEPAVTTAEVSVAEQEEAPQDIETTTLAEFQKETQDATSASKSATSSRRSNPFTKLVKQSLIPRRSTSAAKLSLPPLPSLPSTGPTADRLMLPTQTSVVTRADTISSNASIPQDASKPLPTQDQLPTPPQDQRNANETQYPQSIALQLDWLHAMEALSGDGQDANSMAAQKGQLATGAALSPPSEAIGLGIGTKLSTERFLPPVPSTKSNPKYAHITPPTSDAE
ncbi:unnamed protein product [Tilletia controversa]|uniref:Uncharacterized protein n=2 Tax=Tilletia TaxID=13289 RepID=A0A8X7MKY8_9BASI|nr:hypothetical protein CF328_g7208 [Tilletia controversa]KAE8239849.1 hypothetical protein A4X06_0g8010 [Tilletia controversa]CAD6904961.1 unnamed protein product [Tilletia controversa]CAD6911543.1 unnamed protein product [Tilletia controversa]CAD6970590.1 unnamed protein product [Tilletia controversa]